MIALTLCIIITNEPLSLFDIYNRNLDAMRSVNCFGDFPYFDLDNLVFSYLFRVKHKRGAHSGYLMPTIMISQIKYMSFVFVLIYDELKAQGVIK